MGNCQAAEAATVVIQHPEGKIQRLYWPTTAEEVMKANPGHHVALLTLCMAQVGPQSGLGGGGRSLRITRVRLLKPKDVLLTGQVYKLIPSQEVMKALKQRRNKKLARTQPELVDTEKQGQLQQSASSAGAGKEAKQERSRPKTAAARPWQPSLQSISEAIYG